MNTSAPTPQSPTETGNRLEHLPVTIFAILLGLFGLTLALHAATPSHPWAAGPSMAMLYVSIAAFVALALIYALKAARYPRAVFAEWHHPVKLAFFPTITISMLLMATALHGHFPAAARLVWMIGTVGQGVLTIAVVTGWISHRSFEVGHLTPAWFIPAVGNVIVPLVGAQA
ncbi:MAG TPA: C4-dicarboxylate ABC transporter, partial [Aliiroseovarius sp.]|nr:C4-dicarboxylate ABC transporter [Aliiroseovarius sp.]